MARIGKLRFKVTTPYPTEYPIFYTQKKGFEVRELPDDFQAVTKVKTYGYATESVLENAIAVGCRDYRDAKKSQKLVIVYSAKTSPILRMNRVKKGSYQGMLSGVSNNIGGFSQFSMPLCTLGVDYEIFMQVDDGADPKYFSVDDNLEIVGQANVHMHEKLMMDYTEERHFFFENITAAMRDVVRKLSKFFDLEAENAALFIDNNTKLLS